LAGREPITEILLCKPLPRTLHPNIITRWTRRDSLCPLLAPFFGLFPTVTMSFAAFRAPLRRQIFSASFKRAELRTSSFRKYSTNPPPAAKSSTGLYVGLGAVAVGGGLAYYLYASSSDTAKETSTALKSAAQSAKAATKFVPTKEDYQKVRLHLSVQSEVYFIFVRCTIALLILSTMLVTTIVRCLCA
jgi:hypothetical protein